MPAPDPTSPIPIDDYLEQQRTRLRRVAQSELAAVLSAGGILVDIRPIHHREEEGVHPEAYIIDRNVLEWRLDPRSADRVADVNADTSIVLMCNDGYASSLAAVGLLEMGYRGATDLIGGYRAWARGGS